MSWHTSHRNSHQTAIDPFHWSVVKDVWWMPLCSLHRHRSVQCVPHSRIEWNTTTNIVFCVITAAPLRLLASSQPVPCSVHIESIHIQIDWKQFGDNRPRKMYRLVKMTIFFFGNGKKGECVPKHRSICRARKELPFGSPAWAIRYLLCARDARRQTQSNINSYIRAGTRCRAIPNGGAIWFYVYRIIHFRYSGTHSRTATRRAHVTHNTKRNVSSIYLNIERANAAEVVEVSAAAVWFCRHFSLLSFFIVLFSMHRQKNGVRYCNLFIS